MKTVCKWWKLDFHCFHFQQGFVMESNVCKNGKPLPGETWYSVGKCCKCEAVQYWEAYGR